VTKPNDNRKFVGLVQIVEPEGMSIISDIDDTIKHSDVLDKKELIANTFFRDFKAVSGMAKAYQRWADKGAAFHYVSASPWQLYPSLKEFVEKSHFPQGELYLRYFRIKEKSFFKFFRSSEDYKIKTIETIIRRFPKRKFVLIGDSSEKDPKVYGKMAKRFPDQVAHIFIRNAKKDDSPGNGNKHSDVFKDLPKTLSTVFDSHEALLDYAI